jgi:hypothetical protein
MSEFMENYGTEEQCQAALVASRWPDEFVCPNCGETSHNLEVILDYKLNWPVCDSPLTTLIH